MDDALSFLLVLHLVPAGLVAAAIWLGRVARSTEPALRRWARAWGVVALMVAFVISYVIPMLANAARVAEASRASTLLGLVCAAAAQPIGLYLSIRATRADAPAAGETRGPR